MPISMKGRYYASPTGTAKDIYIVPDSGQYRTFREFGDVSNAEIGKIVGFASVLVSLAMFGLVFVLHRPE